jgi:hypothetical protein
MTGSVRFSILPAALVAGIGLAGCASQTDYSNVSTSPVTMACDGGKTFTVSYGNGFETAVIEAEGRRLQLDRVRTTLGMTPTPGLLGEPGSPQFETSSPGVETGGGGPGVTTAGTTGVRYSGEDAYFLSRNQAAVLEIGDETYSNCQVTRT